MKRTRSLLCRIAMLSLLVASGPAVPSEAGYYECSYPESADGGVSRRIAPRILKFMLNTSLKKAFRIDTRVARKVEILVSQRGVISLMDYDEGSAVSLISIQPDGRSVYSYHLLAGWREGMDPALAGAGIGGQLYGRCRHFSEYAQSRGGPGRG